jgi:hypothetical protein
MVFSLRDIAEKNERCDDEVVDDPEFLDSRFFSDNNTSFYVYAYTDILSLYLHSKTTTSRLLLASSFGETNNRNFSEECFIQEVHNRKVNRDHR